MIWIERFRGSAAAFHGRELPPEPGRHLWWFEVDRPAVVLGSTQPDATVDQAVCEQAGLQVVRRRSGGGAVLLLPDEVIWLDVIIDRSDPRWDDDVGRAMWWIGEAWAQALAELGVGATASNPVEVHRGALVSTPWSRQVCFAGLGPGEVTLDGRKVVGISQRRTRGRARFQCAMYRRWRPEVLVGVLTPPRPHLDELDVVGVVDLPVDDVIAAVTAHLTPTA
jgi:lipoate-protein ligase A